MPPPLVQNSSFLVRDDACFSIRDNFTFLSHCYDSSTRLFPPFSVALNQRLFVEKPDVSDGRTHNVHQRRVLKVQSIFSVTTPATTDR